MNIQVFDSAEKLQDAAARIFLQEARNPSGVIGLATGNTTAPVHSRIVELFRQNPFDTSSLVTCNVDDYAGIPVTVPASCHWRIRRQLLDPIGVTADNGLLPRGMADDLFAEAAAYERRILSRGGIGLQMLGLGPDAHLGFCRPGTPFGRGAHVVTLRDDTRAMLARVYALPEDQLPTLGITLGLKSIMHARMPVVIAQGAGKAQAVADALLSPVTEAVPASVLQLHPNTCWMLDREAAKGILGS